MQDLTLPLLRERFPLPSHDGEGSKDERGRVLVIGGHRTVPGGALLAATAALRAGAGKLQVATVDSIAVPLGVAIPESLTAGYGEAEDGGFPAGAADRIAERAAKVDAALLGPGMLDGVGTDALVAALLGTDAPLILDAAAISALSPHEERARMRGKLAILPHSGELAGLRGAEQDEIEADPAGVGTDTARRWGAVTLVKGSESHVAGPDGELFRYAGGGIGLATSGSGDVLAGIVAGLASRGLEPLAATLWGVWLHGEAGRRLAGRVGRVGFLARELLDEVPGLLDG